MRIVLDTNILIAIIGRKSPYRWIFDCMIDGRLVPCVSNEILLEYREVLERKTSAQVAENVINFLVVSPYTVKAEVYFNFALISADVEDNKFVDCAIASNAVCIVSNDSHFRELRSIDFPRVDVLTLAEFEKKYMADLTR